MTLSIDRPRSSTCGICGEPTNKPTRMCFYCDAAYEKNAHQDGSVMEAGSARTLVPATQET